MNSTTRQFSMQEPLDMEADFGIKVDKLCDYSDCSLDNNGFKEYDANENGNLLLDKLTYTDTPVNKALHTPYDQIFSPYDMANFELFDDDNYIHQPTFLQLPALDDQNHVNLESLQTDLALLSGDESSD